MFDVRPEEIPDNTFDAFQERLALVEQLLDDTLSTLEKREIKYQFKVRHHLSDRTIRSYVHRYRKKGPRGLLFYKPAPKPKRINDKALGEKITALIKELPTRSVPRLRQLISTDNIYAKKIASISDRTIYRFLAENGMSQKERYSLMLPSSRVSYKQFQAPYSMYLVQGDARDGIWLTLPDGTKQKTYLFLWIDDYSRKILFGKYYTSEKLPCMQDSFKYMVLRWGIPEKMYLDNGKVYVSKHFAYILSSLNIKKIHHQPYSAWCKGKVEADMKICKHQFQQEAALCGFSSLDELNSAFWAWCDVYYNKKVHSSTGETPDDRFRNGLQPHLKRVVDLELFHSLFLFRENRKITKYGKVKLYGNEYAVNALPHGKVATILFDPFDLEEVFIHDGTGTFLEKTSWSKQVQNRAPSIPEESACSQKQISQDSQRFFADLREKHLEQQRQISTDYSKFLPVTYKEETHE